MRIGLGLGVKRYFSFSGGVLPLEFSDVFIEGNFTSPFNRYNVTSVLDGSPNTTINTNLGSGFNNLTIWGAVSHDKTKLYVCGNFTSFQGRANTQYFVVLNTDGTFRSTAIGTGFNNSPEYVLPQADGKILLTGNFTSYNGVSANRIIRLNEDLTIDGTFNYGTGFNNFVKQPQYDDVNDCYYIIGGFSSYNGTTRNKFVKLDGSGADITGVHSGMGATFGYYSRIDIPNQKLYIGGDTFTSFNGISTPTNFCAVDLSTLNPIASFSSNLGSGFNSRVANFDIDSSHIYVGGNFTTVSGVSKPYLAKLTIDGTLVSSFPVISPNLICRFASLINNGKFVIFGGAFTSYAGSPNRNRLAVVDLDGVVVPGWDQTYSGGTQDTFNVIQVPYVVKSYDVDYQAVLDYASTNSYILPTIAQRDLQNQLMLDFKDGGFWSEFDTFGMFATDGDSDFALIDWKRLTNYSAVNSPNFIPNSGFEGNGTSAYIDTNYNPTLHGVNYTQNSAGFSAKIFKLDGANRYLIGTASSSPPDPRLRVVGTTFLFENQFNSDFISQNQGLLTDVIANVHNDRNGVGMVYQVGNSIGNVANNSTTGIPNNNIWILRITTQYSFAGVSYFLARSGYDQARKNAFNSIMNNYLNAV